MESKPIETTTLPSDAGTWKLWRVYMLRWLIFGVIAGSLQPVVGNFENFWMQKFYQALSGLPFGFACGLVFTILQNTFNVLRTRWKSWLIVFVTWMGMKFVFVGIMLALGGSQG